MFVRKRSMTATPIYSLNNHGLMTRLKWLKDSVKTSITSQAGRDLLLIYSPCISKLGWLESWTKIFQERKIKFNLYQLDKEPHWDNLVECRSLVSSKTRIWGIGGGSVLDLAKLASVEVDECEQKMDFLRPKKLIQTNKVWLFPTHYSSSAYVSSSATLVLDRQKISGVGLTSEKVIVDPDVLISIPNQAWTYGSVDTITHFVEILCSIKPSNSLKLMALMGWWEDYLVALRNRDHDSLFYLAAFLYSDLFILHSVNWPIHHIAHEFGPKIGLGHGEVLALLLPLFLKARLANPAYENYNKILQAVDKWIELQSFNSMDQKQLSIFKNLTLWNKTNWFDPKESQTAYDLKQYLIKRNGLD